MSWHLLRGIDVLSRLIQCGNSVGATDIFRVPVSPPFHHLIKLLTHGIAIAKKKQIQLYDDVVDGCSFEIISLGH